MGVESRFTRTAGAVGASAIAIYVTAAGALLSKETAFIAPAWIIIDSWVRGSLTVSIARNGIIALSITMGVVALRISAATPELVAIPWRYLFQRALFEGVAGLVVPWHNDLVTMIPSLPILGVYILLVTVFWSCCVARSRSRVRRCVGAMALLTLSLAAVAPALPVTSALEGGRYLYLPAVAWWMLLAALLPSTGRYYLLRVGLGVIAIICCICATRVHLHHWTEAAELRQVVVQTVTGSPAVRRCVTVSLVLPDSVRGAYVFRNGVAEVFRPAGITVVDRAREPGCTFAWNSSRRSLDVVK
jgi:hypothetical protein